MPAPHANVPVTVSGNVTAPRGHHVAMRTTTLRRVCVASTLALLFLSYPRIALADDAAPVQAPRIEPPRLASDAMPRYPESERGSGRRVVVLALVLDETGHVVDASVTESAGKAFDDAALDVGRALVFEPARKDGAAVAARIPFRVVFEEEQRDETPTSAEPPPEPAPPPPVVLAPSEPTSIEIRGARTAREPTVRAIERTEMRTMAGANGDPLRALESMPGVARAPAPGGMLLVRGSAPQDTWISVDGTWIPLAYHFGGVASVIPGDVLERLEYRPGNFGPEHGRAMGGVVEMQLRSPRKDRIGGLAQVDLLDGRLMVEGPLGERTRFLVAGRRSWVDAWLGPVMRSGGTGVTTAPVYADAQVVLEHDLSSSTTARLAFFGGDDRLALLLTSPDAKDPGFGGSFSARTTFTRVQGRVDSRLSDRLRLVTTGSWGTHSESFAGGDNRVETLLHLAQLKSELRANVARGVNATGGIDLLYTHYDVRLLLPGAAGLEDPNQGPLFAAPTRRLDALGQAIRPAAYTQLELTPGGGLTLLPGARVDAATDTRRVTFDPRFAARWDLTTGDYRTTMKGGLGIYHQPPLNESIEPWGDRHVGHMRAIHASVGLEQQIGRAFDVSVEGFAKELDDLIVPRAAETSTASGTAYVNTGTGTVRGVELLAKLRPVGRFSGWLAYTLSRSERRDAEDEPKYLFRYDQTHVLSALGSVDLGRGFTLGARFRYVTGTPITPLAGGVVDLDAGAYQPVQGTKYSARLPDFHRLDVRLEKMWRIGEARLSAYLDVQNVTNAKNPEGLVYRYDYARQERASGLPILPILGLRGEL